MSNYYMPSINVYSSVPNTVTEHYVFVLCISYFTLSWYSHWALWVCSLYIIFHFVLIQSLSTMCLFFVYHVLLCPDTVTEHYVFVLCISYFTLSWDL